MGQISAIFWDVGGVLLSNAWDRVERTQALAKFGLDQDEFHDRHEMVVSSFERGKLTLDEYLDRVIFYRTRPFSKEQFKKADIEKSSMIPASFPKSNFESNYAQSFVDFKDQKCKLAEFLKRSGLKHLEI